MSQRKRRWNGSSMNRRMNNNREHGSDYPDEKKKEKKKATKTDMHMCIPGPWSV